MGKDKEVNNLDKKESIKTNTKTSTGLSENIEGLLTYTLGFLTGVLFLVIEKENKFIRFHAMQSTVVFLSLFVFTTVINIIPVLGAIITFFAALVGVFIWLLLMYKAYKGKKYKLPIFGDFAEKHIN